VTVTWLFSLNDMCIKIDYAVPPIFWDRRCAATADQNWLARRHWRNRVGAQL